MTAEEAYQDQEKRVSEEEEEIREIKKVEKVIVTAARSEMDFYDVPATAIVITSEEIERRNPQNVTELLNSVPGVEVSGTGAAGSFRGIPNIRGWSSNRILILVDGQRLNNTRESTDFAGIIPALVDVHQVERIEVVKGAGAILYGSDALGGVINIITKKIEEGSPPAGGDVELRFSTADDQVSGRIRVNGSLGFFSYRLGCSAYDADDYGIPGSFAMREDFWKAGVNSPISFDFIPGSRSRGNNIDFSGLFRASENHHFELSVHHKETKDAEFPVSLGNLDFINFNPNAPLFPLCNAGGCGQFLSFPLYNWDRLNFGYRGSNFGFLDKVETNVYYQKTYKESITALDFLIAPPPFPGADPISVPLNFLTSSIIRTTGANIKFDSLFRERNQLTYGIDFYEDRLNESHYTNGEKDDQSVPDSTSKNHALYVQNTSYPFPSQKLIIITALRYDWNSFKSENDPYYQVDDPRTPALDNYYFDVAENDLTWNVSTMYRFFPNIQSYINIGRSFRAPNLQERAAAGLVSVGGFFIPNPDLKAETNTNFEIGLKTRFKKFTGEAAIYYSRACDLITAIDIDDPNTTQWTEVQLQNINRVRSIGGEFSITYLPFGGWSFSASYSRQRREDRETGERIASHPQKIIMSARWDPVKNRYFIEWISKFVDRQKSIAGTIFSQDEVPGYGVHSIEGGYSFNRYLTVTLAINNLFDKAYFESLSPNWWDTGRNFVIGLRSSF